MSEGNDKLAEDIYLAINGEGVFAHIWDDEYEERKQRLIAVIKGELSEPEEDDPYIVGLHESEVRKVLEHDYAYFKDKDNLDAVIEALGEFDYGSLWNDVNNFAQCFIDDEKALDD